MNLSLIEQQLRKRLTYPYNWERKQNDHFDRKTNFIYTMYDFEDLLREIEKRFGNCSDFNTILNYSLNRWYNFWSARAVEEIFCSLERVRPASNSRDRLVDFQIDDITFDHKTSVFPKRYPNTLDYAVNNPHDLIQWLYLNQSQQQRKHLKNRLFIVLYSSSGDHWKLKSELIWIESLIKTYVKNFSTKHLYQFSFESGSITLSDIIWGIK